MTCNGSCTTLIVRALLTTTGENNTDRQPLSSMRHTSNNHACMCAFNAYQGLLREETNTALSHTTHEQMASCVKHTVNLMGSYGLSWNTPGQHCMSGRPWGPRTKKEQDKHTKLSTQRRNNTQRQWTQTQGQDTHTHTHAHTNLHTLTHNKHRVWSHMTYKANTYKRGDKTNTDHTRLDKHTSQHATHTR